MRRKDKEIVDRSEIDKILAENNLCRLALCNKDTPYIVSMNYGYKKGVVYLHSAHQGQKIDFIKANNRVCFEVSDSIKIIQSGKACDFNTSFRSVIGNGKISFIEDPQEKRLALYALVEQITGYPEWNIPENSLSRVSVLKIELESLTGKASGEKDC